MYLRKFAIKNIRSISEMEMTFDEGREAGWHVILGANGSGKSSVVKAFALLMMGERAAYTAGQNNANKNWIKSQQNEASISGKIIWDKYFDITVGELDPPRQPVNIKIHMMRQDQRTGMITFISDGYDSNRTIWGNQPGWFSASFGPDRRLSGGDENAYYQVADHIRVNPHATTLYNFLTLTGTVTWLSKMRGILNEEIADEIDKNYSVFKKILNIINNSGIIAHGATISDVYPISGFDILDGNKIRTDYRHISDGYHSSLVIIIEIIRQMFSLYDEEVMLKAITDIPGTVQAPGVVMIDEVDAHLHPSWQRDIGRALMRVFPQVQFIVTTHSPIVCRAVANEEGEIRGSIWRLPAPGAGEKFRRLDGDELNALVYGNVVDAFDTELFGKGVTRSAAGREKIERLAFLNRKELDAGLTPAEEEEQQTLWRLLPSAAGALPKE